MNLLSIEEEAAACRKAWGGKPVGTMAWHLHHEVLCEDLTELAVNRIRYILDNKPVEERALRLRLFRPASAAFASDAAIASAQKAYDAAIASARKAYDAAFAPAWKAYDAAIASAQKAYAAAIASAQKAYAAAIAPARKAYAAAIASAHSAECIDCPWDGNTIFGDHR